MAKSVVSWICLVACLLVPAGRAGAQSGRLETYWVDVECGAATLMIAPSGESLLYDAGFEQAADSSERAWGRRGSDRPLSPSA
jgi:hypothetical protein